MVIQFLLLLILEIPDLLHLPQRRRQVYLVLGVEGQVPTAYHAHLAAHYLRHLVQDGPALDLQQFLAEHSIAVFVRQFARKSHLNCSTVTSNLLSASVDTLPPRTLRYSSKYMTASLSRLVSTNFSPYT